jgi:hypothetical protein
MNRGHQGGPDVPLGNPVLTGANIHAPVCGLALKRFPGPGLVP